MSSPLMLAEGIGDYVSWWQIVLLVVLIGLIVFWVMYRKKQM